MQGIRHPQSQLYMVPVPRSTVPQLEPRITLPRVQPSAALARVSSHRPGALHQAFNAYEVQSIPDLINFYHWTCGNIPVSTWIQAINKNYFATWPGLTAD